MDKNKNQRQPNQGNRSGQPSQKSDKDQGHHRKNVPVASKPGNDKSQKSQQAERQQQGSASENTHTGEWQRPVTNQDEQRRPTNTGGNSPMGEEETEGD